MTEMSHRKGVARVKIIEEIDSEHAAFNLLVIIVYYYRSISFVNGCRPEV